MERGKKEIRREDTWQEWHDGRRVGSEESKKAGCTENREREREQGMASAAEECLSR